MSLLPTRQNLPYPPNDGPALNTSRGVRSPNCAPVERLCTEFPFPAANIPSTAIETALSRRNVETRFDQRPFGAVHMKLTSAATTSPLAQVTPAVVEIASRSICRASRRVAMTLTAVALASLLASTTLHFVSPASPLVHPPLRDGDAPLRVDKLTSRAATLTSPSPTGTSPTRYSTFPDASCIATDANLVRLPWSGP